MTLGMLRLRICKTGHRPALASLADFSERCEGPVSLRLAWEIFASVIICVGFVGLNQYLPVDLAYALRYTLRIVPLSLLKMDRLTPFRRVTSGQHREVFGENKNR